MPRLTQNHRRAIAARLRSLHAYSIQKRRAEDIIRDAALAAAPRRVQRLATDPATAHYIARNASFQVGNVWAFGCVPVPRHVADPIDRLDTPVLREAVRRAFPLRRYVLTGDVRTIRYRVESCSTTERLLARFPELQPILADLGLAPGPGYRRHQPEHTAPAPDPGWVATHRPAQKCNGNA